MSQAIHILSRESSSLSEAAYSRIRSMIITLELEPGSLISESALMSTLKMGRTPIREALRSLANEKLVEVYPRRGMFVSRVDVANLSQLSETRAVLEIKAAELAATRSTAANRAEPRKAPATAYRIKPLIVETSTNHVAMLEKRIEEIAFITLLLINILRIEINGSIVANRNPVKQPINIRSSMPLSYYVFGCAR